MNPMAPYMQQQLMQQSQGMQHQGMQHALLNGFDASQSNVSDFLFNFVRVSNAETAFAEQKLYSKPRGCIYCNKDLKYAGIDL